MHTVEERSELTLGDLPTYNARQVSDGISASSLEDARGIVSRLQRLALCPDPTTPAPTLPSPTPAASASPTAQGRPSKPRAATPSARPRRRPPPARPGPDPLHREAMSGARAPAASKGLMGFVHRRRRGAELVLLLLSLVVGIGAYAAVGLGADGILPVDLFTYGAWLAALVIACHVVIRIFAEYADPILLPIVSALNGLGLAMIHRIDLANEASNAGARTFAGTQLVWMTIGVLLFVAVIIGLRDHRRLQAFTYTSGLAAIVLLLMPLLPGIGRNINGARIWIHLGPMSFQPGEIAKVLLVVAFAGYFVLHRDALALAGVASCSLTCRVDVTSDRSSRCGCSRSGSWCSRTTSAPPCCSSGCSW